ncbi:hypothetical protein RHMOL_Rhmol11G0257200 [Rhododendron molle]|uniref:Uncharacterized protein n=2 Tax=Rhododendron molle TaxID=49168 RepID=A0ACC0LW80_RHOML|nr:hypothetical protein RHMOL_Rhmol11G0257200 [Rhododendron molle]KAI8532940.1 hypothetical protein RHMOL_Rhmol11G0257200 [Rhododendron molle]
MDIDPTEYRLSRELRGHDDDVRGICVCGNVGIATSSRDKTIRVWSLDPSNNRNYDTSKILLGHTSFVGPLAWVSPDEEFPEGRIVSGGMDTLVLVWDLRTGEAVQRLKGHQSQVTGIALDGSDIVSASVDCTLRRWRKGQPIESWEAHKAAIQSVVKLPSGELVTGSSDTTLKLWRGRTCVHTFVGHTDTVRSLAVMPDLGIISASHDGSIRLWAISGQVLMEMVGHTSIVYSVDSHVSGLIVSGSEDCFAKIWKDGVCIQSIEHPGCVWDVKFLENGDIVTACSDGVVRIWTVNNDKIADLSELESFASQLSHYKISSLSDMILDLLLVKHSVGLSASMACQRCLILSSCSSRKKVGGLNLEDLPGLEALQLPGKSDGQTKVVREGDNGVAYAWNLREQKWDKIGEVVDGPDVSMKRPILDGLQYDYVFDVDIGDGEPIRKLPYNRSDNPYATADKWLVKENLPLSYRQQIVEFILQNSGQRDFALDSAFRDPYTGSNAYVPGGSSNMYATSSKPAFKHIPKEQKGLSLTELEVSRLGAIINILKDTSHYHSSIFSDIDIALLLKLVKSWPIAMIFPVIDLLRMIILHPDGATRLLKHVDKSGIFLRDILFVSLLFMTIIILDAFSSCCSSPNKNVQVSYATLILNYSVLLIESKDEEGQSQVLSAALEIAEAENLEVDSKFRALIAIGSLMLEGLVKGIALDFDVENVAKTAKASKDPKIAEVGADIELLVKQN